MKLLFVTQKLHEQDAFVILWVNAFMQRGYTVTVLCLEDRISPQAFDVRSMGKERGVWKVCQIFHFWRYITELEYDRVFIHMSPIWGFLGCWYWFPNRIPTYLWYTHYKRSFSIRITELYARRIFCATEQSVPWLSSSDSKKVVLGHGIDLNFWTERENLTENPFELLVVHRLSRSKHLEIGLHALALLPEEYTMVIYGIEAESDYVAELRELVETLTLQRRVEWRGTTPMTTLPDIYARHRLIVNMASETIDKTMLEAMTCGCYPVTSKENAEAIGLTWAPQQTTPESVSQFIRNFPGVDAQEMYDTVRNRHSLNRLIDRMDAYVSKGD